MAKPINPKELEKRLATAYDAGFFDGYHEGIDDTHVIWAEISKTVKGIGPKRWAALVATVFREMERQQAEKNLKKESVIDG